MCFSNKFIEKFSVAFSYLTSYKYVFTFLAYAVAALHWGFTWTLDGRLYLLNSCSILSDCTASQVVEVFRSNDIFASKSLFSDGAQGYLNWRIIAPIFWSPFVAVNLELGLIVSQFILTVTTLVLISSTVWIRYGRAAGVTLTILICLSELIWRNFLSASTEVAASLMLTLLMMLILALEQKGYLTNSSGKSIIFFHALLFATVISANLARPLFPVTGLVGCVVAYMGFRYAQQQKFIKRWQNSQFGLGISLASTLTMVAFLLSTNPGVSIYNSNMPIAGGRGVPIAPPLSSSAGVKFQYIIDRAYATIQPLFESLFLSLKSDGFSWIMGLAFVGIFTLHDRYVSLLAAAALIGAFSLVTIQGSALSDWRYVMPIFPFIAIAFGSGINFLGTRISEKLTR